MELKPCPLCGQPITRKPYTRAASGSSIRQGVIRCDCGVEMRITVYIEHDIMPLLNTTWYHLPSNAVIYGGDNGDVDSVIEFTKTELAKRWNTRSDSA